MGGVVYANEHKRIMNNAIIIAEVVQAPQMRYTQNNQTAIAEMIVQFPGIRDTDPPSQLKVTGWGNTAQQMQGCQVGQHYVLEGRLQINLVQREGFKEKLAELQLSRFAPGAGALNAVHLVGRAGRDPEIKYFDGGSVVCNFTLAVNRRSKGSEPDWFDIEVWGKTAQVAADYVRKGSLVGITGTLRFDHWNDRNTGVPRSKPVIRVDSLDLLGSKRDEDGF